MKTGLLLHRVLFALPPFLLALMIGACAATDAGEGCCPPPADPGSAPHAAWDAPSDSGPVLCGEVRDPAGRPLAGVAVTLHGGFATRWRVAGATTDAAGRYRVEGIESSRIYDEQRQAWDHYVGVCVGSVSSGNPAEFLPWKDVTVPDEVGAVVRLDFVFDPESVPLERRG